MAAPKSIGQIVSSMTLPVAAANAALDTAEGGFRRSPPHASRSALTSKRPDPSAPGGRWPVWTGSTKLAVEFTPTPKKHAVRLFHRARQYDRSAHAERRHGGRLGRSALAVYHALIFDFLNHTTGRLDPSQDKIAYHAGLSVRSVVTALARLRDAGLITWIRRATEHRDELGRFCLKQGTNAYALCDEGAWRGHNPRIDPPPPDPGTWGDHPGGAESGMQTAKIFFAHENKDSFQSKINCLSADTGDPLAQALARLGEAIISKKP